MLKTTPVTYKTKEAAVARTIEINTQLGYINYFEIYLGPIQAKLQNLSEPCWVLINRETGNYLRTVK